MDRIRSWKRCYIDYDRRAWIVLGLVLLMATVTIAYNDFMLTVNHSLAVWDSLFDGKLIDFYAYANVGGTRGIWTSGVRSAGGSAPYDFLVYVIFALWNLPLWLLERFAGIHTQDYFVCIFYSKLMLWVFLMVICNYTVKISRELYGEDEARNNAVLLLMLSCALLVCNSLLSGCYDVIETSFIVAGVYYYLREDYKRFLVIFAFAVSMKYLAVLILVPLVVYKQKNVLRILLDGVVSVSVTAVIKLIFLFGDHGPLDETTALAENLFRKLFTKGLTVKGFLVPIYVILFFFLCFYVWIWRSTKEDNWKEVAVYLAALPILVFYLLENPHPQWIVISLPFLAVLMIGKKDILKLNLLLGGIYVTAQMIAHMLFYHWVYAIDSYVSMLWYVLLGKRASEMRGVELLGLSVPEALKMVQAKVNYEPLVEIIRIASLLVLLYINLPVSEGKKLPLIPVPGKGSEPVSGEDARPLRLYRIWMYVLILIPCIAYILEMILYNVR